VTGDVTAAASAGETAAVTADGASVLCVPASSSSSSSSSSPSTTTIPDGLSAGEALTSEQAWAMFCKLSPRFPVTYSVYACLRGMAWVRQDGRARTHTRTRTHAVHCLCAVDVAFLEWSVDGCKSKTERPKLCEGGVPLPAEELVAGTMTEQSLLSLSRACVYVPAFAAVHARMGTRTSAGASSWVLVVFERRQCSACSFAHSGGVPAWCARVCGCVRVRVCVCARVSSWSQVPLQGMSYGCDFTLYPGACVCALSAASAAAALLGGG
jgi:hypothetical protein